MDGFGRTTSGTPAVMAATKIEARIGQTALAGWRRPVGERIAAPIASRTRLSAEEVQALVGAAFFALAVYYVATTSARAVRELRGSGR